GGNEKRQPGPEQLEVDHLTPSERGGEQVLRLGETERERRLGAAEQPLEEHERAHEPHGHDLTAGGGDRPEPRSPARPEKEPVEVQPTDHEPDQVLRLAQPRHATPRRVEQGPANQVERRPDHVPVSVRKMSSRLRPRRSGRSVSISSIVPSATLRPRCRMRTRVQISSTRCSRWEFRTTAAPCRSRRRMVCYKRRIWAGSIPVVDLSNRSASSYG